MSTPTIRPIVAEEVMPFWTALARGFGGDPHPSDEDDRLERLEAMMGLDRTIAAFDEDTIVGTAGTFGFDLTVPGSSVPMGGLSLVTVQPTHTRRGLLRAMMEAHLDDVRSHEEPVAGLWASESSIYGRFGFGVAAEYLDISFEAGAVGYDDIDGVDRIALLDADAAAGALPGIYGSAVGQRPGMLSRSDAWWKHRVFDDPEHHRGGKSSRRYAVAYRGGDTVGYVAYRQKENWEDFLPHGTVHVVEIIALDDDARHGLWQYVSTIDLFPKVENWNVPVDFELPLQVRDPRRIKRVLNDGLYVRIVDVSRALEARGYRVSDSIVFGVHGDDVDGTYRLEVSPEGATCAPTDAAADVEMELRTLGSLYLGGMSASRRARAGLISGSPAAIERLDAIMSWDIAPWCPEVF